MTVTIRRTTREDARAIATIRVQTWRAAYAALIDPAVLARLDVDRETERRLTHWDEHHAHPRGAEFVAEVDGSCVGWAVMGTARERHDPHVGELYAIYVLPEYWSAGVGHQLILAVENALRGCGYTEAYLWVLDGNDRAAAFYERHGWHEDGATKYDERTVSGTGLPALLHRRRVRDLGAV